MEFRFNVNEVFKHPIVEINSSLIPPGLSLADKRALWDAVGKVSDVVNVMGEASATAQGLTKPITTSERLRNSEHKLYLLIDQNANNGKGAVTGMLKTGKKGLYVFDRDGHHFQVQPSCVLDFYIHESKQRMGLGKKLYEHMLEKEQTEPVRMAIDRPSDKFLGFLNKHYGLNNPVRQMNNFVVYDGFFPERKDGSGDNNNAMAMGKGTQPANGLQTNFSSPYGRYGAPRPPCSMGQIIHNQSSLAVSTQESGGTSLCIRPPTKTRSANVASNRQEIYSNGNQQICQSMPNIWNQNPNALNNQVQDIPHHQAANDYCSVPSGSPISQNQQFQQESLNQQQPNTLPQFKYNQGPYYPSHYLAQQQNATQQPQLYNQTNASISQDNQLQSNVYQQQPYVSAQNESQRKSVQFTTIPQTIHQTNYHPPMYTQSAHDQRYMQQPTPTNQTVSSPNIPPNQLCQPNMININPSTQYTQEQPKQEQQNTPNPSQFQQQHPTYVQQPQLHQNMYPPQQMQSSQMLYQPQQMYLPERVTSVSQNNQQVQQQYPTNATETNVHRGEINIEKLQPIQNTNNQYTYSELNINAPPQATSEREILNQTNPMKTVMSQPNYPRKQQQQGIYYQGGTSMNNIQYQNSSNYQIPQTPILNQQPVPSQQQMVNRQPITPARNMTNYQQMHSQPAQITPMYNQAQYSHPNVPPQQIYPQVNQPVDPCTIAPPVEAMDTQNQMGKSYQYYDSNAGIMQNMAGEILKQSPVNEPATLPNASGDMQLMTEG